MKKNYFFLLPALALLICAGLQAQVTIGSNTAPVDGAILDLNSPGGTRGGLLLSNIEIEEWGKIPAKLFGISSPLDVNTDLRGMMVYNTGTANVPPGLYAWNGYSWTPDGNYTIVVTNLPYNTTYEGEPVELAVTADGCPSFTYAWYQTTETSPTGGNQIQGATDSTYTPTLTATSSYYCQVTSEYSDVVAVSDLFTVTVLAVPAQPGPIKGFQTVCRTSSQTYSVDPVAEATGYKWTLSNMEWIEDSTSYGNSNSLTVTATSPSGSGNTTISVKAYNSYGESTTAQTTIYKGTVSLANRGGVWEARYSGDYLNVGNGVFNGNPSDYFTRPSDSLLCFAYNGDDMPTRDWDSAVHTCDSVGNGWRLPNIAELKNATEKIHSLANSYWSITQASADNAWQCGFVSGSTVATTTATKSGKSGSNLVRCVKSTPPNTP